MHGRSPAACAVSLLLAAAAGPFVPAWALPAATGGGEDAGKGPLTRIVEVVRAPDGKPAAGVLVEAWGLPGGTVSKRTAADGTAPFEKVPARGVTFVARAPGCCCGWHAPGQWWWTMPAEDGDPDGDGVTRMRLALRQGSVVEGRVLAAADGKPVPGAVVEAFEEAHATDIWFLEGAPLWTVTAGPDGLFRTAEHWPPGTPSPPERVLGARVRARAPGFVHGEVEVWPREDGKYPPQEFRLRPAGTIRGVVTGPDGRPAAGAVVRIYPPAFDAFAGNHGFRSGRPAGEEKLDEEAVRTDGEGRYAFEEARPGVRYFVLAEAEEPDPELGRSFPRAVARSRVAAGLGVDAQGKEASCDLRLRRLGKVVVRMAPDAGAGAGELRVELVPPAGVRPWVLDATEGAVKTFREVDPGPWTLKVDADGWLPRQSAVDLAEGETKEVTVRLDRGASIEGILVDDRGSPVPGAKIYAWGVNPADPDDLLVDDGYEGTRTDGKGEFRFDGLRPGPTAIGLDAGVEGYRQDGYTRAKAPAKGVTVVVHRL